MSSFFSIVERWRAGGDEVALATVVAARHSAPRPPGSKMAITATGKVEGMVSGGCVESSVAMSAKQVLEDGVPRLLHFGIADAEAFAVGLPCGGEIDVWVERLNHDRLMELAQTDSRGARIVRLDDGRAVTVDATGGRQGTLGSAALDAAAIAEANRQMWLGRSVLHEHDGVECFIDAVAPAPRLIIFGAVDYARALATLARTVAWKPYVIDPRSFFANPARFPDAEQVIAAWPAEGLERLGGIDAATAVVVLTHDPKLDDAALDIALRSDAPYVGAMGSRRMQADRRSRLLALGLAGEQLARLAGPVGLDLGALTTGETALSIMSEIIAVHRGRTGGRLRHTRKRIHEAAEMRPATRDAAPDRRRNLLARSN